MGVVKGGMGCGREVQTGIYEWSMKPQLMMASNAPSPNIVLRSPRNNQITASNHPKMCSIPSIVKNKTGSSQYSTPIPIVTH